MTPQSPAVTVVVPMYNEERTIRACLESILANDPPGGMEVLVMDGASTDRSVHVVEEIAAHDPRVEVVHNPARLQADAFNLGLGRARGVYLVRMDAHSRYASDYIAESVRLLEETGAVAVGGVQRSIGHDRTTRAIAAAVSSPFAAGDAKYRYATEPAFVDTVYLGAWRTASLREVGGMMSGWAVNEDYEMNVRLRKGGGRLYLSPTIRSEYHVRGSLPKLVRQYFRYGFWKVRTLLTHPASLRWRQLVAPAFVISVLLTPLLVHLFGWLGALHLLAYLFANLGASLIVARRAGWQLLPMLPLVFLCIHLAWGTGFLVGIARWLPSHGR